MVFLKILFECLNCHVSSLSKYVGFQELCDTSDILDVYRPLGC